MMNGLLIGNGKEIIPYKDKPKNAKKTDWYVILPGDFYREEHYVDKKRTKVISFACSLSTIENCGISLDEFRTLAFKNQGIKQSYGIRSVTYPKEIYEKLLKKFYKR